MDRAVNATPELLARITIDPEICHGKLCIRGLPYPVEIILELLSGGATTEDILRDYEDLELEDDGRWIAEVPDLRGVLCYGATRDEAIAQVQALALRVLPERLDHAEAPAELLNVAFLAA